MQIVSGVLQHQKKLFTQDYYSNPAMLNSFQTNTFICTLTSIEMPGASLHNYVVEEAAQFLILSLQFKNIGDESIWLYKEDFQLSFDQEGPYDAQECIGMGMEMAEEICLQVNDVYECKLLYIIASDAKKICFSYIEWIDDDIDGKCYKLKYQLPMK